MILTIALLVACEAEVAPAGTTLVDPGTSAELTEPVPVTLEAAPAGAQPTLAIIGLQADCADGQVALGVETKGHADALIATARRDDLVLAEVVFDAVPTDGSLFSVAQRVVDLADCADLTWTFEASSGAVTSCRVIGPDAAELLSASDPESDEAGCLRLKQAVENVRLLRPCLHPGRRRHGDPTLGRRSYRCAFPRVAPRSSPDRAQSWARHGVHRPAGSAASCRVLRPFSTAC
jgi:hypothetical protein